MKHRQRMKRVRKPRFAEISIEVDDDEREVVMGPPDEGTRAAHTLRVRA